MKKKEVRKLARMRELVESRIPAALAAMRSVPAPTAWEIHAGVLAWIGAEHRRHQRELQEPEGSWIREVAEERILREFRVGEETYKVLAHSDTPVRNLASWAVSHAFEPHYQRCAEAALVELQAGDLTIPAYILEEALERILLC